MLSDQIKTVIRQAYKSIGNKLEHFTPRKQQTFLIAEIAKTLSGHYTKDRKIITLEAGTGTGKSLAYCLGAIPLAVARNKKVCISTATVALQEQLVDKDLPFLQKNSGLTFNYTLVKGRQRYVCRQKLSAACAEETNEQTGFTFAEKPQAKDLKQLNALYHALKNETWQGDRDSWPEPISQHIWQQIQSDKHSCKLTLGDHQHCPFHKARDSMEESDVLVINHSLLLADLELGGGKILPAPEECFYIIDEAHHLPTVARDFSSANVSVRGAIDWITKLKETADKISTLLKSQKTISPALSLGDDCQELVIELEKVARFLESNSSVYFHSEAHYRFENGIIPKNLKNWAHDISELSRKSIAHINKLYNALVDAVKEQEIKLYQAEPLLAEAGFMLQRMENHYALWQMYAKTDPEKGAPLARWLEKMAPHKTAKKGDITLCASPIEVGFMLEDMLWSKCEGAVLCSATIRALNSFDHFRFQAGLAKNDGSQYLQVDSPFNYQQNAKLVIAKMQYEPSAKEFTNELIEKLPAILENKDYGQASLVLFSSYWQMNEVAHALRDKHQLSIQVQDEQSRQHIIKTHKKRIDDNKKSIIFGTQSFSEGLDLPGKYLTNLIITKLPFAVPTSPVEEAQSEYIASKGGNPFMSLTVPETSKKLIQATGRLLRNEQDQGVITLLDCRVITKRYGKQLLDALPPFKRIYE
jgi:ATP-dependent DNA helicase DinG